MTFSQVDTLRERCGTLEKLLGQKIADKEELRTAAQAVLDAWPWMRTTPIGKALDDALTTSVEF